MSGPGPGPKTIPQPANEPASQRERRRRAGGEEEERREINMKRVKRGEPGEGGGGGGRPAPLALLPYEAC